MNLMTRKSLLDDFFDDWMVEKTNSMKCDIYEKDGKYFVEMDIPGFDKKDISVDCSDGYLTIEASKENESEDKDKNYIRKERTYGSYKRQFYVGNVDTDNINAEFKDGILKIEIPTIEEKDTKKYIDIK